MTPTRTRKAYFNVPASQQPLRVREVKRAEPTPPPEPVNVLEQLIVVPHQYYAAGMADQDRQEAMDAFHECDHGRLPHDTTPPCGCWPQEPAPASELIPDWVLADARDYQAQGITYRKIARMILPATGCQDIPDCEQLLKLKLETEVTR